MAFPTTTVLDNFNSYTAGTYLASGVAGVTNWDFLAIDQYPLTTNGTQAYCNHQGNWAGSYWTAKTVSLASPGEIYATVAALPAGSENVAVSLYDTPTSATPNGYAVDYSSGSLYFLIYTGGNASAIGTYGVTLAAGDIIGMSWNGSGAFTIYHNSTSVGSITDTTHTGNMYMALEGNNTTYRWDNFGGGLASAATTASRYIAKSGAWSPILSVKRAHSGSWV